MKNTGFLNHVLSIILLPGIVAGIIPYYLDEYLPEPEIYDDHIALKIGGILFMTFGLFMLIWTVFLFDRKGRGTLAPWSPPRKLVIAGPYKYVRNPMIIGVISILFGEALFLNSIPVLIWAMVFFVINTLYIEHIEERKLERKFGDSYVKYKNSVSRWMPSTISYILDNK